MHERLDPPVRSRATVSILIPVLNEAEFIQECLSNVLSFEVPAGIVLEVLVLDGGSTDSTRELLDQIKARDPRIRVIENPARIQSTALNLGLRAAVGDFILRLDAHSFYPRNYLSLCLETALRTEADNVGGVVITKARGPGFAARVVQALTTHPFGVGDASFRVAPREGEVDTVPYGFFRRNLFEQIGFFDERLVRAQDYEMNRRIKAAGGRVWMNPAIKIQYYQQPTLRAFLSKQYEKEAPYNVYLWYCAPYAFAWRHALSGFFAAGVIIGALLTPVSRIVAVTYFGVLLLYTVLSVVSAVQQSRRYGDSRLTFVLPPSFFLYHFIHGLGVLKGAALLALRRAPVQRLREPWPGAGRSHGLPAASLRTT